MLKRLILCVGIGLLASQVQARDIVLAFENTLQPSTSLDGMARSQMLMGKLASAGVAQAMFLVKTRGLDSKAQRRLALYSTRGQLLVNTGHNQSLVAKADLYVFEIELLKADRILRPYSGYRGHVYFSYLHEVGDTLLQQGLTQFLQDRGFIPAYINANPWRGADAYIDKLYQQRLRSNRPVDMAALEALYVDFVEQMLLAQSAEVQLLMGYTPPQVLLLQETDLAAYFIDALVERLEARGFRFVPAVRAMDDPLLNPLVARGFGANSYWPAITAMPDTRAAYPRVLGPRQAPIDELIRQRLPELLATP